MEIPPTVRVLPATSTRSGPALVTTIVARSQKIRPALTQAQADRCRPGSRPVSWHDGHVSAEALVKSRTKRFPETTSGNFAACSRTTEATPCLHERAFSAAPAPV